MVISHQHKFIYFGPTKTASTSISRFLVNNYNAEITFLEDDDPFICRTATGRAQHQMRIPKGCADYFVFLSIRNPYTRFASMYQFFGQGRTIEEYTEHAQAPIHFEVYGRRVLPTCIPNRIDQIVRFESLEKDFNTLPFLREKATLPIMRVSPEQLSLSPAMIDFVNNFYSIDFDTFGYQKQIQETQSG